jgi:hypothetical protein
MQPQVPQKFAHNDYRSLSMYTDAQQYFYNDPRVDIYRWGLEAGAGTAWHPHPGFLLWHQNGGKMQTFRTLTAGMHGGNAQARDNFMDVAGIRWVFGGAPWPQIMWGGAARELRFSERPSAIPRFTLYTNWQPVPDIPAALHWLASADNAELHRRPAVEDTALVRGRECRMSLPSATGATPSAVDAVTLLEDRNNSLSLRVRGSGLLVVSDTWHPGWRATIDGVEAPVHRANHMFRGVFIPAGEHTVRFDYWPVNFGWHLAASALGLCIIGGLFIRRR